MGKTRRRGGERGAQILHCKDDSVPLQCNNTLLCSGGLLDKKATRSSNNIARYYILESLFKGKVFVNNFFKFMTMSLNVCSC